MKLKDYLSRNNLSLRQFARHCKVSAATIMRAGNQDGAPSRRVLEAIWKATGGHVCPNDIIGLHPTQQSTTTISDTKEK